MKTLVTLLFATLLVSPAFAGSSAYPDITLPQLQKAIAAKDVTLLDVNGTESYDKGHIPGAIDFTAQKANIASLLPKNKSALVVAYCANPHCGAYAAAAAAATKLGYTNVKHFPLGIQGWEAAKQPVDKGSK
ncbi:MAG: rhodanese-like domain-containing protein [Chthoniobacterales bacterium]